MTRFSIGRSSARATWCSRATEMLARPSSTLARKRSGERDFLASGEGSRRGGSGRAKILPELLQISLHGGRRRGCTAGRFGLARSCFSFG